MLLRQSCKFHNMLTVISDFGDVRMFSQKLLYATGICVCALFPAPAFAYLDPGTGSALIQGVIASLAALGLVLKVYWHRVLGFLGLRQKTETDPGSESEPKTAPTGAELETNQAVKSSAD